MDVNLSNLMGNTQAESRADGSVWRETEFPVAHEDPSEMRQIRLDVLTRAMERGSVAVVQMMLSEQDIAEATDERVKEARAWLLEAEVYETFNGPGSRLDPNHWFNKEIERGKRIRAAQDAWLSEVRRRAD